jgi:hypothetical protein
MKKQMKPKNSFTQARNPGEKLFYQNLKWFSKQFARISKKTVKYFV